MLNNIFKYFSSTQRALRKHPAESFFTKSRKVRPLRGPTHYEYYHTLLREWMVYSEILQLDNIEALPNEADLRSSVIEVSSNMQPISANFSDATAYIGSDPASSSSSSSTGYSSSSSDSSSSSFSSDSSSSSSSCSSSSSSSSSSD